MRKRLFATGIGLILLGVYLLFAPIQSGADNAVSLKIGHSVDVYVPRTSSITGSPVTVMLSQGSACVGYGPCYSYTVPTYLEVWDCGASACVGNQSYSVVGTTPPYPRVWAADFSATPGHHYLLVAQPYSDTGQNETINFGYAIYTPILGGSLGAGLLAVGSACTIFSIHRSKVVRTDPAAVDPGVWEG